MPPQPDLTRWRELATSVDTFEKEVKIAIVGKVGRKEGRKERSTRPRP